MLKTTEKLLPRSYLVATLTATIPACFMRPATSFRVSRLKIECQNAKKCGTFIREQLGESFENLLFHQFPILVISRKCHIKIEKRAYISKVRACFCWIPEKSQNIQLEISFHHDNFRVDYFQRQILPYLYSVDFFSVNFEHISWNYRN